MNHPLTDEMCDDIRRVSRTSIITFPYEDMRTAADWQLEQVIDWLSENLGIIDKCPTWGAMPRYLKNIAPEDCSLVDEWKVISDLRKAMRPQEDN